MTPTIEVPVFFRDSALDGPPSPPTTEHLERSWTQAQQHPQEAGVLGAKTSNPDKGHRWSFGWGSVALPMIA